MHWVTCGGVGMRKVAQDDALRSTVIGSDERQGCLDICGLLRIDDVVRGRLVAADAVVHALCRCVVPTAPCAWRIRRTECFIWCGAAWSRCSNRSLRCCGMCEQGSAGGEDPVEVICQMVRRPSSFCFGLLCRRCCCCSCCCSCSALLGPHTAAARPADTTRRAARMDARRFCKGHGCPLQKFLPDLRTWSALARKARGRGVLSFGYFSLHKQRKVTRARQGVKAPELAERNSSQEIRRKRKLSTPFRAKFIIRASAKCRGLRKRTLD